MWYQKEINRNRIRKYRDKIIYPDCEKVSSVIEMLQSFCREKNISPDEATIYVSSYEEYGNPTTEISIQWYSLETEEERDARVANEEAYNKKAKEERRKLLKALKEELGE